MNRGDHLLWAIDTELVVAHFEHLRPWHAVLGAGVAVLASWGPDVDQLSSWHLLDRWLPDELLGHGGPMRHRGITHWWLWPLLAALALYQADTGSVGWLLWALWVGWTSHLVGDFLFGERPHGIPMAPWWAHVGIRSVLPSWLAPDSGGLVERYLFVPGATVAVLWWLAGWPGAGLAVAWAH